MPKEPGYCLHKPSGQAYVNLGGTIHYLGKYGSQESREAYNRLKAEWLVNRFSTKFRRSPISMAELCLAYLDHAENYYGPGTELKNIQLAIKPVSDLYATLNTDQLTPLEYEVIRNWWLKKPSGKKPAHPDAAPPTCSRQYVNCQMKRLMRIVKWGVSKGLVPCTVHQTLKCVEPLKRGRVDAPECEPIKPVDDRTVELTCEKLTPILADMVKVQRLLGCRPGELVKLTPAMIDRSSEVWRIDLNEHKTSYRGKSRTIFVGPKAQAILTRYLLRGANDLLFSPADSERQRREAAHAKRKTPPSFGNKPGSNRKVKPKKTPGKSWSTQAYSKAISRAAQKAGLKPWSANQLRHSRATEIRSQFGIEAAASILGHSEIGVTQVYAEADLKRAIEVARLTG